jgi:hypothetical protein
MIPTRDELILRAQVSPIFCSDDDWGRLADFALAEIRRALIAEMETLLDGAPPTATNEWWYQAILNRVSAMIDKPGAKRPASKSDSFDESATVQSPKSAPALTPATATHNSSARVTYAPEPLSDADALDTAAEILRTRGLMVSAAHLESEATKLRAPKPVDVFERQTQTLKAIKELVSWI